MENSATIAAIATPNGKGALGIIRVTGYNSFQIVKKCLAKADRFVQAPYRKICLNEFITVKGKEFIDEITVIKYRNPDSFTGEDMVEIICHGGTYIIKSIMDELENAGAISAQRGEFTRRAFLNGKMDLMKAESIIGMIDSTTDIQHKTARNIYKGEYQENLEMWHKEIIEISVDIESEIEFSEEDDVKGKKNSDEKIKALEIKITEEIEKRRRVKKIEEGIRIVIAGPPNAGKSTLFNKILGYKRAITSDIPGTTRDSISEKVEIDGKTINLVDSAGIRITEDKIELEGINRTIQEIEKAELVLWMTAADEDINDQEIKILEKHRNIISLFINKADLGVKEEKKTVFKEKGLCINPISLKKENGFKVVLEKMEEKVKEISTNIELPTILINKRQEYIATNIHKEIKKAIKMWNRKELAAFHINNALEYMEEFLGKRNREEVMNNIFESFCIGK